MSIYRSIPNALTLLNLLLGCIALVYLFYDHIAIEVFTQAGYSETGFFDGRAMDVELRYGKMHIAALLVIAAALLDFLDGFAARLFNAESAIGKQLDSLADMVTFGLVPGVMMYYLLGVSFFGSGMAFDLRIALFVPGFFVTLCAAYRLARFNTDSSGPGFTGLPVPAAAMIISALPLILYLNEEPLTEWLTNSWILYGLTAAIGFLMISKLPLMNLKFKKGDAVNRHRLGLVALVVVAGFAVYLFFGWIAAILPLAITLYIIYSLIINTTTNAV